MKLQDYVGQKSTLIGVLNGRTWFFLMKRNLMDGPDGFSCNWHDLRKEKNFNYSRNFAGGSFIHFLCMERRLWSKSRLE